jgi:hemerythrin-like domain-containing protein
MPLTRHKSLYSLSHDHHHGLILAQVFKIDTPQYKGYPADPEGKAEIAVDFYEKDLKRHFQEEENILYPVLKERSAEIDALFSEIIDEHKQITNLIDLIKKKFKLADSLNELGVLLSAHIRKEERVLFTMIQELLTDKELDELEKALSSEK